MSILFPQISAPTNMDIEITTACPLKCRHCYNFWQHTESQIPHINMSIEQVDQLVEQMALHGVFHVVLTGGEAMTNYKVLTHFMRRLNAADISFSMNSNLMLATQDKIDELASLGLPHILTSLNSYIPAVNDKMVSRSGAFERIIKGIRCAVKANIRISVNMITTQLNKTHVYDTGLFLADLGVTNLFTTRMVPCTSAGPELERELQLDPLEEKNLILDEAIRVKQDTGLNIGSLIQYPVCFLKDVIKYRDYVGRGCPAGRKMMCVHADGNTEACFHENQGYGNVFQEGIKECWRNMQMWRNDSLIPKQCLECDWLVWCEGACRLYTKTLDGMDLLASDSSQLPSTTIIEEDFTELARGKICLVPSRLRFRQENGYFLVSVRGASVYDLKNHIAEFLIQHQKLQKTFTLQNFPGTVQELGRLIGLWIVESTDDSTMEPVSTRSIRSFDNG